MNFNKNVFTKNIYEVCRFFKALLSFSHRRGPYSQAPFSSLPVELLGRGGKRDLGTSLLREGVSGVFCSTCMGSVSGTFSRPVFSLERRGMRSASYHALVANAFWRPGDILLVSSEMLPWYHERMKLNMLWFKMTSWWFEARCGLWLVKNRSFIWTR